MSNGDASNSNGRNAHPSANVVREIRHYFYCYSPLAPFHLNGDVAIGITSDGSGTNGVMD
jgi:hypothetical protein